MERTRTPAPAGAVSHCPVCESPTDAARCGHCGAALKPGGFVVERLLAQTPHSRVYRAHDSGGRVVALKELHFAAVPGPEQIDAFEREVETLASVEHMSIPRLAGSFTDGTGVGLRLYLATEYVSGESLAERLQRGPLPEAQVFALARQLLQVLTFLHQRSPAVLHRDIKPANVMFRADESVVLVDFGSARFIEGTHTHRSSLVGTFGYMPPEQLGGTVDRSSDVFSVGATLLHAATGRPPSELLEPSMALRVPPGLSQKLTAWLERAVALERDRRFKDAREALDALDAPGVVPAPSASRPRTRRLALLTGALVAAAGAVAVLTRGADVSQELAERLPTPARPGTPEKWFERVRGRCNTLEVGRALQTDPPPGGAAGTGYAAGCFMLAGRLDDARRRIESLAPAERAWAAKIVFDLAHPFADSGDDLSAGPMMELVLDYWPQNFQALYHAGIAAYGTGDSAHAKQRLEAFLAAYHEDDGFTSKAKLVLERIAKGLPAEGSLGAH